MKLDNFHPLLLNVGKAKVGTNWNWRNVCSPFTRIYYVVSGEAAVEMLGQKIKLRPGRMYLIPPFTKHSTACQDSFVHYYIHVYEDGNTPSLIFDNYDVPFEYVGEAADIQLFVRLCQLNPTLGLRQYNPKSYDNERSLAQSIIESQQSNEWMKMETRGLIYTICSRFMQHAKEKPLGKDQRIMRAIQYMHSHLTEPISIRQITEEVGLSTAHFIRLFTDVVGTTPLLYLNSKRVERAQLMLHTTTLSIKEIALSLGYEDNSYFVRVFKRNTGVTPSEYRKTAKS